MNSLNIRTDNSIMVTMARNDKRKPWELIRELIDNSIDAKATIIRIEMTLEEFSINDNGTGISKARMIESWSHCGRALSHSGTDIGKYNLGMKVCLIALSDRCTVSTKTATESYKISFDWTKIDSEHEFQDAELEFEHGTQIDVESPFISNSHIKKTLDQIAKTYRHLLQQQTLLIKFNGRAVHPSPDIPWISKRDIIGDGYRIEFGLWDTLNDEYLKSEVDGVTVWYKNRMVSCGVKYDSIIDIPGNYSIQLFIDDGEKYSVSALKDEVKEAEEIIDLHSMKIRDFIVPEYAKETQIELNSLFDELSEMFGDIDEADVKGKREQSGQRQGTVHPKNTEQRKRFWDSDRPDGPYQNKQRNGVKKLRFSYKATDGLGCVEQSGKTTVVYLDNTKPEVKKLLEPKMNRPAVCLLIAGLLETHRNKSTLFSDSEFSRGVYDRVKGRY